MRSLMPMFMGRATGDDREGIDDDDDVRSGGCVSMENHRWQNGVDGFRERNLILVLVTRL